MDSTYGWEHWVHSEPRTSRAPGLGMLDPTKVANVSQEPRKECVVAYRGAVADDSHMLSSPCYGHVHPPTIAKETNSSESVRPDLKNPNSKSYIYIISSRPTQSAPAITRRARKNLIR